MLVEFLLSRRPIAHQSKDAGKRQRWKEFVAMAAQKAWDSQALLATSCHVSIVYFCGEQFADIDNIIKPILDAMTGIVYVDDSFVTDVDSHRRPLTATFDFTRLPALFLTAVATNQECVYVRVAFSKSIEFHL